MKLGVMMDPVATFYSGPQLGSGIQIYSRSRRQVGSGLWGTLQRLARPILTKFLPRIGSTVANKAINVLAGAASDALNQRSSFGEALKTRGKAQLRSVVDRFLQQRGGKRGVKRRAMRKPSKGKRRKTSQGKKRKPSKGKQRRKTAGALPW
jgi:hypothetical protein